MNQPTVTLHNGIHMPQLGLGVWQAKNGAEVRSAVLTAIKAGYRMIDTAAAYGNENGVGKAIAESGVPRSDLFVTTKLWNADQGFDKTLAAYDKSLKRLGTDYVDLYLIHWPAPTKDTYIQSWKAMEQLYNDGKVKAIGVSNFSIEHLKRLMAATSIIPAVNQIEVHPYFPQTELRAFCAKHDIAVISYSPLGGGGGKLLDEQILSRIAMSYDVSPAQIVIRWHIQHGLIVIPKSVHADRIISNSQVFDFALTTQEMAAIDNLATGVRVGADPETTNVTIPTPLIQAAHRFGLIHW